MNEESNLENSFPYGFGLTNSNPMDIEDQNQSNLFTQPIPQQQNNFSSIKCLSERQNINNRNPNQNNAYQLAEKLDSVPDPPLEDTESQNVPQHPEEIREENPTRPRKTKKPPKSPLEDTESQNVPQHPEEIREENSTRPRRTKKPPKPKIIRTPRKKSKPRKAINQKEKSGRKTETENMNTNTKVHNRLGLDNIIRKIKVHIINEKIKFSQ